MPDLPHSSHAFLSGGGEMGRRMRAHDWASSPLGPPEGWPQSLRTALSLMLNSRHPMFIAWGPELAFIYNDGYAPILGNKHPDALGRPFREIWAEIWQDILPLVDRALSGVATWSEDLHLVMLRNGFPEDTWYTFSYSPVRDESGGVGGMFCACTETTSRVLEDRRAALRLDLADRLRDQASPETLARRAVGLVAGHLGAACAGFAEIGPDGLATTLAHCVPGGPGGGRLRRLRLEELGPGIAADLRAGRRVDAREPGRVPAAVLERLAGRPLSEAAYLAVPVMRDGRLAGLLHAVIPGTGRWQEGDVNLVAEVAERTYSAVTRTRAVAALREGEERFRNMADHAPLMMWVTNERGACTYLNKAWYAFTGQSEAEGLGLGWLDATHPDDKARTEQVFLASNAARAAFRVEYRLRGADGRYRWCIDAAAPRFAPDGTYLGYVGSVIDIDERHEAERRLEALADALPAFVWFATPDGHLHHFNARWYEYTGQTPDEALPDGWAAMLHPDDVDRTAEAWADARAREVTYEVEVRYRRHDGAYRWYLARAEPVRDADGSVIAWFGTSTDVHDQREAAEALKGSEARLRAAVLASPFPMMLHAEDGEVLELGRKWTELTGYSRDQIRTHFDWLRLAYPDSAVDVRAVLDAEFDKGGEIAAGEWAVRCADGSTRVWDFHNVGLGRLPDGRRLQISAAADVTDRKAAEAALRALNATLEARVAERTAEREAALAQLAQAQKMEAVGQLTGGVAHDFNNLLQALSGCLSMIGRRAPMPEVRPLVEAGQQAVDRGARLVQQMMAFSRPKALSPQPLDVRDRVLGLSQLLARTLPAGVRLETDFAPGLWPVQADPTQFELALLNLATNARDAMPEGGTLTFRATNAAPGPGDPSALSGRYVRLEVADTGVGMSPDVAARAFEPFFTTKDVGAGTGLGLAQVYGLARQCGGTARVDSAPGRGTTVTLMLRAAEAAPAAAATPAAGASHARRGRVLLVEDEPLVASTVAAALGDAGYEVARVATADEALPLLQGGARVDLLFSDVVTPGRLTGVDLAREARRLRPGMPVVLTTGYSEDVAAAGGVRVLPKPCGVDDILRALDEEMAAKVGEG